MIIGQSNSHDCHSDSRSEYASLLHNLEENLTAPHESEVEKSVGAL